MKGMVGNRSFLSIYNLPFTSFYKIMSLFLTDRAIGVVYFLSQSRAEGVQTVQSKTADVRDKPTRNSIVPHLRHNYKLG